MAADASTLSTTEHTDPLVPTYTDGTPINWDGNYAHIDGALYETGRYYKRTGLLYSSFSSSIAQSRCPMAESPWNPSIPYGSPQAA